MRIKLSNFKVQVESKLTDKIDNTELRRSIDMAMRDVVYNNLVLGQDVKAEYFQEVVARCVEVQRKADDELISRR
jgi:hypothetical protein